MSRGTLRIYLGAAPGVGKTFAMLGEGRRRRDRGTDVVVGFVETHGRARTAEQIGDLEIVPRRQIEYRGTVFEEMDTDAVLARRPEVALVDELAHTNVPGSRNEKRWQDVNELLDAGITVISTVNIQHLESINDVVESITGVKQRETIPDEIVRAADQVELIDMTPEALQRRMAHGNIYAAEKVDAALAHYFRVGNLTALRELALLWVADQVDVALDDYRDRHGISQPWETRERVVVAITGAPGNDVLIRRAARIARRAHGALLGVHVQSGEGLASDGSQVLDEHRRLLTEMGGAYHETVGADIAAALVHFARAENATQIVLGASRRSKWQELVRGSVVNRVVRLSGPIDVHVVSEPGPTTGDAVRASGERASSPFRNQRPASPSPLPPRRRAIGWCVAAAGVPLLALALAHSRGHIGLPTVLLLFLGLVVVAAAVGGRAPAFAAAAVGSLAANWYFTPPFYELTIAEAENAVALLVFLGVAAIVSSFVVAAARRSAEATLARAQAETLAALAATMGEEDPLLTLLGHLTSAFQLQGAAILRRRDDGRGAESWEVEAAAGDEPIERPEAADVVEELVPGVVLALAGSHLPATEHYVLKAFAAQLAAVLERHRLRAEAGRAQVLAEANELRTALLRAVSHDLRTPLASIKASSSSLCAEDVTWSAEEIREFATTIDEEADRLTTLVTNLLDMSRLQVGALQPSLRATDVDHVIAAALYSLGSHAASVDVKEGGQLPLVLADPALLERAVANVIDNATRYAPAGRPVRVQASAVDGRVEVRIVDQGPGIPRHLREQVFHPFQRLGDSGSRSGGRVDGVGLGLAVARGFLQAMGGTVEIDDTPGGGTTVTITLPQSDVALQ